jgi:succinate-semialdehyde dehydrogenase/glutarate-semialdehyde dehydrogenase
MTVAEQILPGTGDRVVVRDRSSGAVVQDLAVDTPEAVAARVARARAAQPAWDALGVRGRAKLVKRARKELARDRAEVLALLERETGKARRYGELMGVCMTRCSRAALLAGSPGRVAHGRSSGKRGYVSYRPRGVVGIISPWNAPLNLALAMRAGAARGQRRRSSHPSSRRSPSARLRSAESRPPAGVLEV